MQLLYSLLLTLVFITLLPYFAYQSFVNRKYLSNFRERMGILPDSLKTDSRPVIWLHAVSVGETLASLSLVKALRTRFPYHRLIISTTTATGQLVARSRITEADGFCYFPFDWKFSVRRALDVIQPQIVILMESELWLNFLSECKERKIPVLVANGRISDRSYERARKIRFLVSKLYKLVTYFTMQSKVDALRAMELGAPAERVVVSGNIKYDIGEAGAKADDIAKLLDESFALNSAPLVVAGSTNNGEEEIILAAFEQVQRRAGLGNVRLLIAPRHPERFEDVAKVLDATRLKYARRSAFTQNGRAGLYQLDVILLDSIGELSALYAAASIVFVGGSLVPTGGHNILEPALYAKPIIVGPHMENFREITNEFLRRNALIQLRSTTDQELVTELTDTFVTLLEDQSIARELGANAREAVEDNRGASARTVEIVSQLLQSMRERETHEKGIGC